MTVVVVVAAQSLGRSGWVETRMYQQINELWLEAGYPNEDNVFVEISC
jgi:hypothetical protein